MKPEDWYLADIEEDNAYVVECRNGHTIKMSLHNVRYELLYESGVVANLVGFHREAVSSFAASLERFDEFAVEVLTSRASIEPSMHEAAWKPIRKQSERQFGAFIFMFLVNFRRPFLARKELGTYEEFVSFRNEVIHQGRFPSRKETMDYARYVFELIRDTRTAMRELDADAVQRIEMRHHFRGREAVETKAGPPKANKDGLYRNASGAAMPMMLLALALSDADGPQLMSLGLRSDATAGQGSMRYVSSALNQMA